MPNIAWRGAPKTAGP